MASTPAHANDRKPENPRRGGAASGGVARVKPGGFLAIGPFGWLVARVGGRVMGTRDVHLFSTLGRARRLFATWLVYSGMMMPFGVLSRRDSEMIILRVAHLRGCEYEWNHHTHLGRRAGIDDAMRARIAEGPDSGWGPRERAMLVAAEQIVALRSVDDAAWTALAEHLSPRKLVGFVQLVCQYDGLATGIGVLRIQPDIPR